MATRQEMREEQIRMLKLRVLFDLTAYIMPGLLGGGYFDMVANVIYDQAMEVRDQSFAAALSILAVPAAALAAKNRETLARLRATAIPPDSSRGRALELDPETFLTPASVNEE